MINLKKAQDYALILGIFFSILSQMPSLRVGIGIDPQILSMPIWGIVLCISTLNNLRRNLIGLKNAVFFFALFICGILFLEIITFKSYISSVMTLPIITSIIMLIIGFFNYRILDLPIYKKIAIVYISATIILCIDIYFTYLITMNFNTIEYVFKAKNSAGQIIVTGITLLLYLFNGNSFFYKICKYSILLMLLTILIMIRSRASILSLIFIPGIYLYSKNIKKEYKIYLAIIFVILGIVMIFSDTLFNIFVKNLLFNSTENVDLNQIDLNKVTSERYDYLTVFPALIENHILTGIGDYYMDNFYFAAILNYGIILGGIVILFSFYPIIISFRNKIANNDVKQSLKTIAMIYCTNSLFECLAPYGPGVKCFFLWLMIGALLSRYRDTIKE